MHLCDRIVSLRVCEALLQSPFLNCDVSKLYIPNRQTDTVNSDSQLSRDISESPSRQAHAGLSYDRHAIHGLPSIMSHAQTLHSLSKVSATVALAACWQTA